MYKTKKNINKTAVNIGLLFVKYIIKFQFFRHCDGYLLINYQSKKI